MKSFPLGPLFVRLIAYKGGIYAIRNIYYFLIQYLMHLFYHAIFDIPSIFASNIQYFSRTKITGDIDILRDFIHNIRYLANILSDNQYLTPPRQSPLVEIMETIPINSCRFFKTVTSHHRNKPVQKNNAKTNRRFELYRFTLYILRNESISSEKL